MFRIYLISSFCWAFVSKFIISSKYFGMYCWKIRTLRGPQIKPFSQLKMLTVISRFGLSSDYISPDMCFCLSPAVWFPSSACSHIHISSASRFGVRGLWVVVHPSGILVVCGVSCQDSVGKGVCETCRLSFAHVVCQSLRRVSALFDEPGVGLVHFWGACS